MQEIAVALALAAVTVVLVVAGVFALGGLLHWTKQRDHGYFTYFFYLALLAYGTLVLSSGRDFSLPMEQVSDVMVGRSPLLNVVQKLSSIILLLAAAERLISYFISPRGRGLGAGGLLIAYTLFWICTVASPALFGWKRSVSHEYLYALIFGATAICMSAADAETAILRARNALLLFLLAGWLALVVNPSFAADLSYKQGFIPGMPRFAGLAAHAVSLGMLSQIALLCLWARPLDKPWLNRCCWSMVILTLILAQSKTAWSSCLVCVAAMMWVRHGDRAWQTINHPRNKHASATLLLALIVVLVAAATMLMFGDSSEKLQRFLDSSEGSQLTSLTGRDQIWAATWREWLRHPVFGYGLTMFDVDFRAYIGISAATHAHNQFMDTLGRSGAVGAATLIVYVGALLVLSLRYARATQGLSLALFTAIALRGVSEVPLSLTGYGPEFLPHLLLLIVISGAARANAERVRRTTSAPLSPKPAYTA